MRDLFKFETKIRVAFEDVDLFSVVNNAKYFSYFERGRIEYLRCIGFVGEGESSLKNFESVVAENFCSYKKSAVFDDLLTIHIRISFMKRSSMQFQYYISRETDDAILTTGYTNLVWFDTKEKKAIPIRKDMRETVTEFEGDNLGKNPGNPSFN